MAISLKDWSDGPVSVLLGDVRERLSDLPDQSVQCVVTSPPYWGLRDYKAVGQVGLEPSPESYVETISAVFGEVWRVLRKDGSLWLNLGDSYAGSWGAQSRGNHTGDDKTTLSGHEGNLQIHGRQIAEHPHFGKFTGTRALSQGRKAKDLTGIPWMVAFALRTEGWYLRSDIIWSKPNPMPESVLDRPTKAHEYLFLLTRSDRYYYNAEAIKEPPKGDWGERDRSQGAYYTTGVMPNGSPHGGLRGHPKQDKQRGHSRRHAGFNDRWDGMSRDAQMALGANKRSVWEIATQPYPEAHFATFPEALVEPCILAGSAEGDTVLDPFAGSGTTLAVARRLGRKAIGIELQPDYLPLIQKRVTEAAMPLLEAIESA